MNEENFRLAINLSTTLMSLCFGIPTIVSGDRKTTNKQFVDQALAEMKINPEETTVTEEAIFEEVLPRLLTASESAN